MIEQRSVVLTAIILAFVLAGVVFFFVVGPGQIGTGLPAPGVELAQTVPEPSEPAVPEEVPVPVPVIEEGVIAGAQDNTPTPTPTPDILDVTTTAETGSGSLLLLAALLAIGLGLIGAAAIAFGTF